MSKAKSAIESQLKMLKRALEFMNRVRGRIRVLEVYVVGSRARGDYRDDSDIDLVIISNDVEGWSSFCFHDYLWCLLSLVVRRWVLKPILNFLKRDDPDELGEGDLGEATFGEGSGCEPLATGGDPLPQLGVAHGKAVEKETVGTNHRLRRDGVKTY